jgi:hypothetical protein
MKTEYLLRNALTLNATGEKYNAVATRITAVEIRKHKAYFIFNFSDLISKDFLVYKICKEGEPNILLGIVSFLPDKGILNCGNMEISNINKRGKPIYNHIGKCMIALCCKISFDLGNDGYITFEAKNRLMPYYKRYGADFIGGLRMVIRTAAAKKLVANYF